jgi:hypothetical protein
MRPVRVIQGAGLCLIGLMTMLLPACSWDGHFSVLGYTTQPLYDLSIKTVRVPIFKNVTFRRGLEFDLTEAVVNAIHSKTPYRVVQSCEDADTELIGTIASRTKAVTNFNQIGETRNAETTLTVEVVWRDLRPGHVGDVLSQPRPGKPGDPPPPLPPPGAVAPPVLVQSIGTFIPELGGSLTTAEKTNVDRIAVQIVSMMEKPW